MIMGESKHFASRVRFPEQMLSPTTPRSSLERPLVERAERLAATRGEIDGINNSPTFVAASPAMQKVLAQAELLAQVDVPVLIVGEKATGKSTTAQLIHKLSVRSGSRFARVSCSRLASDQLEQELFGIKTEDGSGIVPRRLGELEFCGRGTLLLEDISEMRASLQARVVSAVHPQRIVKFGGVKINREARVLATSTADGQVQGPDSERSGALISHLSAFTIHVPALRHRKEDIPLLLSHFMKRLALNNRLPFRSFSAHGLEACLRYSWPGNLTELENFARAYLALGDDALLMIGCSLSSSSLSVQISGRPRCTPKSGCTDPRLCRKYISLKALVRNANKDNRKCNWLCAKSDRLEP